MNPQKIRTTHTAIQQNPNPKRALSRKSDGTLQINEDVAGGIIAKMMHAREEVDADEEGENNKDDGDGEGEGEEAVKKMRSDERLPNTAASGLAVLKEETGEGSEGVDPSAIGQLGGSRSAVASRLQSFEIRLNTMQQDQEQNQKNLQIELRSLAASLKNISDKLKYGRR